MSFRRFLRRPLPGHDYLRHPAIAILGLRLTALALMAILVGLLWRVMAWLPWQVDCLIAAAAAGGFAYRFEREAEQ